MAKKIGRCWYDNNGNKIDLYELYKIWGGYIKTYPSQMTPELVDEYLETKQAKRPPFQDRVVRSL